MTNSIILKLHLACNKHNSQHFSVHGWIVTFFVDISRDSKKVLAYSKVPTHYNKQLGL